MADSLKNNDALLLSRFIKTGDLEILGELYQPYMPLVYGVCLKYLQDRESSKDAVMQIFEKLIVDIPNHDIQNFKSWLYVVSKNFCLMKIRADKSKNEKHKKFQIEQEIFVESENEMHPIDEIINSDPDKALKECIEKLKAEQKQCIELFYFRDKCYREISEMLSMDEKKVKSYLQNGKRNLKICLENKNVSA